MAIEPKMNYVGNGGTYCPPQPQTLTYPYWYTVPDKDAERFRFALEMIADGDLTKEAIQKIAKAALRQKP